MIRVAIVTTRAVFVSMLGTFFVLGVVACGSSRGPIAPSTKASATGGIKVDSDRFPHGVHTGEKPEIRNWQGRGLACADCHDPKLVAQGKNARAGTNQHSPCDDGKCHKAEFGKAPGKLCKVCHVNVDPFEKGKSPLQPYPERGATESLAASFSHKLHLDSDKMESASGAHVACGDCHIRDDKTRDPQVPGHAQCVRCHEQQAKVKAALPMEKCAGCHPARGVELTRGRRFIINDLIFHHSDHERDKAGESVKCTTCHSNADDAPSREEMQVPAMERCAQCHEDAAKSPDKVRMQNCNVCHSQIDAGTPPTNHMVGGGGGGSPTTRPTDHTLNFRKHHGEQAAAKDAPCRFCHTQVRGAKEDSCFQCHQLMKPQDHNLMFRDDHGRDAQTDGQRCANCHQPEYCSACHSIPPRSHTPFGEFRLGGHAELARFALSSCLACHTYEDTCVKCHRGQR